METMLGISFSLVVLLFSHSVTSCKSDEWRNMTMEELLFKSDVVVYGKDIQHGKLRLPTKTDARFDVYCVIKKGKTLIPGQIIIEDINEGDACSGVKGQTKVGQEYIVGVQREFSGFMTYSDINPLQTTAFPATAENFNKLAAACGLDEWTTPETGNDINKCPTPNKPRFCTKIRDPSELSAASSMATYRWRVMTLYCLSWLSSKLLPV